MHRDAPTECGDDLRSRLADRDDGRLPRDERLDQVAKVAALESSAENDDNPALEAFDGPACRLDVGRLRVVDEADAADFGDWLQRMLEPRESFDGARHRRTVYTCE